MVWPAAPLRWQRMKTEPCKQAGLLQGVVEATNRLLMASDLTSTLIIFEDRNGLDKAIMIIRDITERKRV